MLPCNPTDALVLHSQWLWKLTLEHLMTCDASPCSLLVLLTAGKTVKQTHSWSICLQPLLDCVTNSSGGKIPSTRQPASCSRRVNCCGTRAAFNIHPQTFQVCEVVGWVKHWEEGVNREGYRGQGDVGNIWFPLTSWANNLQNKTMLLNCCPCLYFSLSHRVQWKNHYSQITKKCLKLI